MNRKYALLYIVIALLLLTGCGYKSPVMQRVVSPAQSAPDSRYGQIYLETVKVYRPAKGLRAFPDGGTPYEQRYELVYHQIDGPGVPDSYRELVPAASELEYYRVEGRKDHVVAQIPLTKIDGKRYGDLIRVKTEWIDDHRFKYLAVWGFWKNERQLSGEVTLQPLK